MSELEELLSRLEHAVLVLGCSNCGNITDEGIRAAEKKTFDIARIQKILNTGPKT